MQPAASTTGEQAGTAAEPVRAGGGGPSWPFGAGWQGTGELGFQAGFAGQELLSSSAVKCQVGGPGCAPIGGKVDCVEGMAQGIQHHGSHPCWQMVAEHAAAQDIHHCSHPCGSHGIGVGMQQIHRHIDGV